MRRVFLSYWRRDRLLTFVTTVHKSASDRDIRAAYKRLSKKFHPDKNKDPDAEGKFVEIARGESERERMHHFSECEWLLLFLVAYEVLSDSTVSFPFLLSMELEYDINTFLRNAVSMIDMAKCVLYFSAYDVMLTNSSTYLTGRSKSAWRWWSKYREPIRYFPKFLWWTCVQHWYSFKPDYISLTLYLLSDPQGQQVRRGPSSLTEFEVSLADMCVSCYVPSGRKY